MSKRPFALWLAIVCPVLSSLSALAPRVTAGESDHPLPNEVRRSMKQRFEQEVELLSKQIDDDPQNVGLLSRRGDALFFLGEFSQAVRDYDRMVELDPTRDASHWRRGIAYFYAGEYEKAAAQFSRYDSFDNVDRENGIWRYLSQYRAGGKEKARAELLKYEKDDRQPFGEVYRLFAGDLTAEQILKRIEEKQVDTSEREKQRFYAELYIGLNELVEGREDSARLHLRRAVSNTWAPRSGYGPEYMWQVARIQFELLLKKNP